MDLFFSVMSFVGIISIGYFTRKNPDKKKRNIAIALTFASILMLYLTADRTERASLNIGTTTTQTSTDR
ncbi:MAG: hypothetical protein ACTJHC_06365 [Vagococcus sp.]